MESKAGILRLEMENRGLPTPGTSAGRLQRMEEGFTRGVQGKAKSMKSAKGLATSVGGTLASGYVDFVS